MTFCILTSLILPCNSMDVIKTGCSLESTFCPCQKIKQDSWFGLPLCSTEMWTLWTSGEEYNNSIYLESEP